MRRAKLDRFGTFFSLTRQRSVQILIAIGLLYLLLVTVEIPFVLRTGFSIISQDPLSRPSRLHSKEAVEEKDAPSRPLEQVSQNSYQPTQSRPSESNIVSGLVFDPKTFDSQLYKPAKVAWEVGRKFWEELQAGKVRIEAKKVENRSESCRHSISLSGSEFSAQGRVMVLPCGLTLGSHITLVGRPKAAHQEAQPNIALVNDGESVMVSQFKVELLGLKTVEGEEPPRLLHFNPRLKGDWSGKPVIELNTCYRMQWGSALRCEGWKSKADDETVDGQVKCEKWIRDDDSRSVESKATWWLSRLVGRTKKVPVDWPYSFTEEKLFVLTLSAGLEGYHINVDGRHITSFPYHSGFSLEDATGLSLSGDVDLHSVFAASLPSSHPSFAPQKHLEMSTRWRAPPLSEGGVELFIGILSAGNHFAERMAVRKSWMQHSFIQSSKVVARFFVALHAKGEVNIELKKEAEFFGDIVIVPYMDNYDLVVLKTVAICEYGVRTMSAKYIMKCDDDTFVRVDAVIGYMQRASAYRSAGRIAEAIADCNRTLALEPSCIQALDTRASLLETIRCLPDCLHDLEHLKLLYNAILRDRKLAGPTWKRHNVRYREIPGKLCVLTTKIQQLKQRVASGETGNVDYYALIGLRRGCSRSELERAHLLLCLRHKPDKATIFIDRCELADDRDVDSIRDKAKMSALLLYRLLQKGYSSVMTTIMEEEAAEKQRKKAAAALGAAQAAAAMQLQVTQTQESFIESSSSSSSCSNSSNRNNNHSINNNIINNHSMHSSSSEAKAAAASFQGVFCRDIAVVGNLLSQVGFNRPITVKYEALSC